MSGTMDNNNFQRIGWTQRPISKKNGNPISPILAISAVETMRRAPKHFDRQE